MPSSSSTEQTSVRSDTTDYGAIHEQPDHEEQSNLWSKRKRWIWMIIGLTGIGLVAGGLVAWPKGTIVPQTNAGRAVNSEQEPIVRQTLRQGPSKQKQPNILFIMADDLGWGDVSWHDSEMQTPNIASLARKGVILNQSYVNMLCSPTRSAFFTGYDPYHIGTQQGIFAGAEPVGVPLNFTFFTNELQKLNYKNYLVGKWHLGYCKKEYLPTYRGFDYFEGFLQYGGDYYTHETISNLISKDGLVTADAEQVLAYDYWKQDQINYDAMGNYSTELFTATAIKYLDQHKEQNADNPMFMYLAYQSMHFPLQVPSKYMKFCHQKDKVRQTYCAMGKAMDDSIGTVIDHLKDLDMYDDTLIVFQTDNGGDVRAAASNFPLRGNKATLWEGGQRAIAFVHSPKLLNGATGERNDLFFVTDWYPTFLTLAGKRTDSFGYISDGVNQWPMIQGLKSAKKRQYLVYNIDLDANSSALRFGNFKLIIGNPSSTAQYGADVQQSDGWYGANNYTSYRPVPAINTDGALLYDVIADPTEQHDLYKKRPLIVKMIKVLFEQFKSGAVPNIHVPPIEAGDPRNFNNTMSYGFC